MIRYRRAVLLAVDLHDMTVDGQDRRTRPDHEIGQGRHQRRRGIAIDQGC
jgi:hypothetical protein